MLQVQRPRHDLGSSVEAWNLAAVVRSAPIHDIASAVERISGHFAGETAGKSPGS